MTVDQQVQALLETFAEYDAETVQKAIDKWQNARAKGYVHPTEGWVSGGWPQ